MIEWNFAVKIVLKILSIFQSAFLCIRDYFMLLFNLIIRDYNFLVSGTRCVSE